MALLTIAWLAPAPALPTAWLLLGAPLTEELVFRAGLQDFLARRWARWHLLGVSGVACAVATGSLAFAAAHELLAPGALAVLTFFPSLLLGALYARTRRLRHAVALHAAFNACWLLAGSTAVFSLHR
jgi:membrane protease YdiL (CAAX protease family)